MSFSVPATAPVISPTRTVEDFKRLYEQLLEANQSAFDLQLFTVAFHALSGALGCATQLQQLEPTGETNRLLEVERRAEEQIALLGPESPLDSQPFTESRLSFYRALEQVVDNQRALHPLAGEDYLSQRTKLLTRNAAHE